MGLLHGYNPSEAAVQSSSSVRDCYFRPSDNGKVGVSDEGERARSVTGDLFRMCVCLLEGDRETDAICTQDPAVAALNTFEAHRRGRPEFRYRSVQPIKLT